MYVTGPPRHVAAWLRGCCYLSAGNFNQALRDARTALAYAAETGVTPARHTAIKSSVNHHPESIDHGNTPGQQPVDDISRDRKPVTAAAPSLQSQEDQHTRQTALLPCSTPLDKLALDTETSQIVNGPQRFHNLKHVTPQWFPAALLAGQAYAQLGEPAQAALHLAEVGALPRLVGEV